MWNTQEFGDTDWVDDDRTPIGQQHPEEKNFAFGIEYAWWMQFTNETSCWTLRRPTPMTTWKPRSRETSTRSTTWTRECARSCDSLRSLVLSHSLLAHIAWLKMFECLSHIIHAWSERLLWLPWSLHHLHLHPLIPHFPQAVPSTLQLPRGQVVRSHVHFAKEMGSTDESFFNTAQVEECFDCPARMSFQISVLCLGKIFENPQSNDAWEERLGCFKSFQVYRNFDRIDGEPMEFEWNISQDSIRCSSVKKFKSYCWD